MTREQHTDAEWTKKSTRHRRATTFLSQVRKLLGWTTANCKIRSNKAGPAVGGEVTLHSETVYVHLDMGNRDEGGFSYARKACLSKNDCGSGMGSPNMTIPEEAKLRPENMVEWLKRAGLLR